MAINCEKLIEFKGWQLNFKLKKLKLLKIQVKDNVSCQLKVIAQEVLNKSSYVRL